MTRTRIPITTPAAGTGTGVEVDWLTRRVANPVVARLTGWGISVAGTRILAVRGRTSGETRTTVVNLLHHDGQRFLVAPRGATQWVRNLRVAGVASLRLGRRVEEVAATELGAGDVAEQVAVLRAYLQQWSWQVGKLVGDLRADSPDADLIAALPRFPTFRLSSA